MHTVNNVTIQFLPHRPSQKYQRLSLPPLKAVEDIIVARSPDVLRDVERGTLAIDDSKDIGINRVGYVMVCCVLNHDKHLFLTRMRGR